MLLHCPICDRDILTLNIIPDTGGEMHYEAMCRKCWWKRPVNIVLLEEDEEEAV